LSDPAFDPYQVFRTLTAHGVRFVVVGGLGARLHGSPVITNDADICYERSDENLELLAAALRELGARLRGVDEDVRFSSTREPFERATTSRSRHPRVRSIAWGRRQASTDSTSSHARP
jgi:hypothetical protein